MATARRLNCVEAQKAVHKLLDRRWTKPIPPSLQDHFEDCPRCASWRALLNYEPTDLIGEPASDFADQVIRALHREKAIRHPSVRAGLFASAAALILVSVFAWSLLRPRPIGSNQPSIARRDLSELLPVFLTVKQEIEQVPERLQRIRPPSFDLLSAFPEMELQVPSDPLTGAIPSVRALGTTLQGAIEPIETPAKEAYQKVKMIIHDPNVKKWFDSVTNGIM